MDRYSDMAANNAANLYAPGVTQGSPMTHTESVTNSLQNLLANLRDSNARLQEARDRMFGAMPETAAKDGPRPLPNGRVDEIEMLLSSCHDAASRNQELAGELLRRL